MKSISIIPLLIAAVYAQTDPLIPPGISGACTTYLTKLDSDPQILSCTKVFTGTIANFGVGSNSKNASASAISSTLNTLCSSLSTCSQSVIRSQLSDFYTACSNELTSSPVPEVTRAYEVLYTLTPMSQAICAKGDSGKYCVLEVGSTSNATGKGPASNLESLWQPLSSKSSRRGSPEVIVPDLQVFKDENLAFLGIQPTFSTQDLCQPCTRNVLNEYIKFTSSLPFAPGITNSLLMGGETDLYTSVQTKCGAPFLSGSVQAAGGISNGVMDNGAAGLEVSTRTVVSAFSAIIAGFFIAL